jgi:hypothetical protein
MRTLPHSRRLLVCLSPCLLVYAAARAQPAPSTAPTLQPPRQTVAFLAPYLTPSTLLVAHADLAALDSAALFQYLDQRLAKIPGSADARKSIPIAQTAFDLFLVRAKQLGIRHLYLLADQTDITLSATTGALGGAILIPLPDNADPKPAHALLQPLQPALGNTPPALLSHNVLALGSPAALARLQNLANPLPNLTPNLIPAFTPNAPFQLALVVSPDIQRVLHEMPFSLPPLLGNQPITAYTDNLQSLALNLDLPPSPSATLAFSAADPQSAARIADAANSLLASLLKSDWFTTQLQSTPPGAKQPFADFLASLHFAPAGNTAAVHLDASQVSTFLTTVMTPDIAMDREQALRVQVSGNIRQLMIACATYAADHNGQFPPSLQTLVDAKLLKDASFLTSPRDLKDKSLTYHPWSPDQLKKIHAAEAPMIWEHPDAPADPLAVGFADGHVEIYRSQTTLEKTLKDAETKAK